MSNIQRQIDYYNQNYQEINSKYAGQVIIINQLLTIENVSNEEEGYKEGVKKYGYGNFLLKKIRDIDDKSINIVSPIITSI